MGLLAHKFWGIPISHLSTGTLGLQMCGRHELHVRSENSHVGALHTHGKCFNHGDISSALGTSVLSKEVQGAPSTPSSCQNMSE